MRLNVRFLHREPLCRRAEVPPAREINVPKRAFSMFLQRFRYVVRFRNRTYRVSLDGTLTSVEGTEQNFLIF